MATTKKSSAKKPKTKMSAAGKRAPKKRAARALIALSDEEVILKTPIGSLSINDLVHVGVLNEKSKGPSHFEFPISLSDYEVARLAAAIASEIVIEVE
jgi:hypothetical protein